MKTTTGPSHVMTDFLRRVGAVVTGRRVGAVTPSSVVVAISCAPP